MAVAVGDVGQGDADVGGQPESRFISYRNFLDLEPGRRRDRGVDGRRDGVHPAEGQAGKRIGRESGTDGCGSGTKEVFAGVYESVGQGGSLPSVEARRT